MRGGTSKGLFFLASDLPDDPEVRDRLLIRAIGSPDPYRQHMDGLGGATSSTSKVVIVGPSQRPDCDVDYRFGAVAVDRPVIDWSGNCGNLSAAVGPFALHRGLLRAPRDGIATVRIWQADIRKVIHAHVPVADGEVVEDGDSFAANAALNVRRVFFAEAFDDKIFDIAAAFAGETGDRISIADGFQGFTH